MSEILNAGILYVVATPIGHLGDLTRRAEDVLKQVQIVACEDTRRTRVLLDHIDHRVPELLSFHEHNQQALAPRLIGRLAEGDDVALVSDAGTPLVNDPGFPLVAAAHDAGLQIVPVPGACSITTALSVCPLACQPFRYIGFLPAKAKPRRQLLADQLNQADAIVCLEAPHRILASLAELQTLTDRRVMIGRELTKKFESVLVGTAAEVATELGTSPKGEIVLIIEAGEALGVAGAQTTQVLTALLKELSPAQAARLAAAICGEKKSAMYDLAMRLSERQ